MLTVCIVNWNTRDLLRDCLASLEHFPADEPMEVIVVDNASSDGSAEMVQAEFPQTILIANSDNRGYAEGNNQALVRARGDTLLPSDWTGRADAAFGPRFPGVVAGAMGISAPAPAVPAQPQVRGVPHDIF
jgi:glycosyltransferase involved in cell wall biosynthesis